MGDGYIYYKDGKAVIRWYSTENPWMDFVVIVDKDDASRSSELIDDAIVSWWEDDNGFAYGDVVENALADAGIDYDIHYIDFEADTDEDYFFSPQALAWEERWKKED